MTRVFTVMALLIAFSLVAISQTELQLKDIAGKTLRLSDYKGKVVLINFWATWCAPCRAEMPDLIMWQKEYRSQGLQIIGITYPPQELAEVRKYAARIKVNYPVVIGSQDTRSQFDEGDVLPLTVVVDRQGQVRDVIRGVLYPEEFDQRVKPLLSVDLLVLPQSEQPSAQVPTAPAA